MAPKPTGGDTLFGEDPNTFEYILYGIFIGAVVTGITMHLI
jgi:hypothetical protein